MLLQNLSMEATEVRDWLKMMHNPFEWRRSVDADEGLTKQKVTFAKLESTLIISQEAGSEMR